MTIIRGAGPDDAVVSILRSAAQDQHLSYRARGILAAVMSRPRDWRTDAEQLAQEGKEGEHAVLAALRELQHRGYLRRGRIRQPNGRILTEWVITDDPARLTAGPRFPRAGEPRAGLPQGGSPRGGKPRAEQPRGGEPRRGRPRGGSPQPEQPRGGEPRFLLEGETEGETPPPTPAGDDEGLAVDELERVVVGAIRGKCPTPGRTQLRKELSRLGRLQWTAVQLHAAVEGHDWRGARAGAVITFLRQLQAPGTAREAPQERPAWCGACNEATRLLEDPETHVPRRCPTCHPSTRRDTA